MKVLIDTNVILDVMTKQEPHYDCSAAFLRLCDRQVTGLIVASQTTDIFYILCREGYDEKTSKEFLKKIVDNVKIISIIATDVTNALKSEMKDYKDALLAFCGKRQKVDYIITRNEKDFEQSPVSVLSPHSFLEKFFSL